MKAIVADALMAYMEESTQLTQEQHGFRRHRSCTTNLLLARSYWTEIVDTRTGVDVVNLDFSKAFDRLDHRILLIKLQTFGIDDPLLGWIGDFLLHRCLEVKVRGSRSDPIQVECGVPQGSVLGPRLFLTHSNHMTGLLTSNSLLYADDIGIWRAINTTEDALLLQANLQNIHIWAIQNSLQFNVQKCQVPHVRHKMTYPYKLGNEILQTTSRDKDLGVFIQDDLGCSFQAEAASKKGLQHLGLLRRAFGCFNQSLFQQLLGAYIRPHMEHAIQVWQPWLKRDLTVLELPQRRATKYVKGLYYLPYEERLKVLGVFSGRYRRLRGDLILAYQILSNPTHACHHLLKRSHNGNLRGHNLKLIEQYSRLECRRNFFPRSGTPYRSLVFVPPRLWRSKPKFTVSWSPHTILHNSREPRMVQFMITVT